MQAIPTSLVVLIDSNIELVACCPQAGMHCSLLESEQLEQPDCCQLNAAYKD